MSKATSFTRTGLLACLMAMVGFSYALATSNSDYGVGGDVSDRAAGSYIRPGSSIPLDFANPFVSGPSKDRDLGDAVVGSALTRLVRAKGGVPSYSFVAGSLASTLKLLNNGILTGTLSPVVAPLGSTPFRFNVTVTDSLGTGSFKTEVFRLSFFSTTQFRFAIDKLSDAVQFTSYSDTLSVLNGGAPIKFTATNVTLDGVVQAGGLSDLGLALATDGAVFGTVLKGGVIKFTATATDKAGAKAAGRSGTGSNQVITINSKASKVLASLITASKITIKQGVAGKDSVSYKGIANLDNSSVSKLSGQSIGFRVGLYTAPAITFDAKGKAVSAKKVVPAAKASVNTSGLVSFTSTKDTIDVGPVTGSTVKLAVEFRIGDSVVGSEVLNFSVKAGKGTAKTLTYQASGSSDLDGSFQLVKVDGADDKGGLGDSWKVGFIGRTSADFVIDRSKVNLSIGSGYSNSLTLSTKGTKSSGKEAKGTANLTSFSIDSKSGKGFFTTTVLPSTQTGISQASKSGGKPTNFAVNMTFGSTGFAFEGALGINPVKSKWTSKLNK